MTRADEAALIDRAKSGEAAAMADLIRGHQESLYAFMLRMTGRPEVAEDVVQEAFVRVLKNLDRFDPKYRFSTWLFTIAKRLYVNWAQKFSPTPDSDLIGLRQSGGRAPVSDAADSEWRVIARRHVETGLAALGETQREIILLFHQQGWSISSISNYMEMPEGTIKSHLHRARRKMREAIEEHSVIAEESFMEASW